MIIAMGDAAAEKGEGQLLLKMWQLLRAVMAHQT
jgi:hypothetical protein